MVRPQFHGQVNQVVNVYGHDTGLLRLELPKQSYERAGLAGEPIRDAGRKHVKTRYGKCYLGPGKAAMAHHPSD